MHIDGVQALCAKSRKASETCADLGPPAPPFNHVRSRRLRSCEGPGGPAGKVSAYQSGSPQHRSKELTFGC